MEGWRLFSFFFSMGMLRGSDVEQEPNDADLTSVGRGRKPVLLPATFFVPPPTADEKQMCWCVELVSAAAELIAGVCLAVQGDHGHVEDLRFPRCLRAGHLPDVLLTSGARQVRRRQPLIYLIFSKMQVTFG